MKTLKDYLAETIRRYGAVGTSPGMGYTLESSKQVDMKGKKCTACKKGTYEETGIQDNMHGELHCTKCNTVVKSRQPAKSTTSKEMQDRALEKTKQTLSKPENMAVLKRLKTKEDVSEENLNEFLAPDGSNYGGGGGGDEPRQFRVIITLYDDSSAEDETAERKIGITVTATSEKAACDLATTMLLKSPRYDGSRITNVTARPVLDEQTMSRAAKGYEKYGKAGMAETADGVKYGVFAKGGSVGSQRFRDDPLKTFDTKEEAIADARRRRSGLSKGERGYYRMGYVVKPIKGSAEQVDEIDMGLVGDALAGAAAGLGSVGLGSYIGHKIGNKIGQKFIDRSNRKKAEAGRKEAEAGSEKMKAIEKARADRIAANRAYRDHENLHGYELAQDHPEYQNRVNLGNKKFRNMDVPSAFDEDAASNDPLLAKSVDLAAVSALEESAELRLILQRAKLIE